MSVLTQNVETPPAFPDSTMDQESDIAYPCKGCGEILEEGKAFELAGNRWHLGCFKCNTCGTLLDSDANLLLLGDGSLICNKCTYSCSACGEKIEDLAILTGDQAFCANCFRCRNCKRKIENLRYARTSQGIFCMSCHESLMARRRKKTRLAAQQQQQQLQANSNGQSPMLLDKSLPSLPPAAVPQSALTEGHSEPPMPQRPPFPRGDSSSSSRRERSPAVSHRTQNEHLGPHTSKKENRRSTISHASENGPGADEFFIPLALDTGSAAVMSPTANGSGIEPSERDVASRDASSARSISHDKTQSRSHSSSRTHTKEREGRKSISASASPHIAYQEKGRVPSDRSERSRMRKDVGSAASSPVITAPTEPDDTRLQFAGHSKDAKSTSSQSDQFKLQEVPRSKRSGGSGRGKPDDSSSISDIAAPRDALSARDRKPVQSHTDTSSSSQAQVSVDSPRTSQDSRRTETSGIQSLSSDQKPQRRESLGQSKRLIARKEVPTRTPEPPTTSNSEKFVKRDGEMNLEISLPIHDRDEAEDVVATPTKASTASLDEPFTAPRRPPQPPSEKKKASFGESPKRTAEPGSPALLKYNGAGDFSLDEDMARILGTADPGSTTSSIFRRASNAVRHGRSHSDMSRPSKSIRWPKSPLDTPSTSGFPREISSPSSASPEAKDELIYLRHQLRRSLQKQAELQAHQDNAVEIKTLENEVKQKRSTIAMLDAKNDIMLRKLQVLESNGKAVNEGDERLDDKKFQDNILTDFAKALDAVAESYKSQIAELIEQRNKLLEESANLKRMNDQAALELEQNNNKNSQLADLNNELTIQIRERYKANREPNGESPRPSSGGLGIYTHHHKEKSDLSVDLKDARPSLSTEATLTPSQSTLMDSEPATVLAAPHVVNIRKGQAKKFNWKKGGHTVAKGAMKGFKGAFGSNQKQFQEDGQLQEGIPYSMITGQENAPTPVTTLRVPVDASRPGFGGFFGSQKFGASKAAGSTMKLNGLSNDVAPLDPKNLFGSDLQERADFEKRSIPGIVTRCIEEVELRGMDLDGIYRKSGGNSQVKQIQEGFEKSDDYDISDPDLDITAVTSVLKQYFRNLPVPLLTFDVYDKVLESTNVSDQEERVSAMKDIIQQLPSKHRDCLEFLVFHLARVATKESINLMTPKNLAVVFAPTIMRDHSVEREMTDFHNKNNAIQFLIENNKSIFG